MPCSLLVDRGEECLVGGRLHQLILLLLVLREVLVGRELHFVLGKHGERVRHYIEWMFSIKTVSHVA